MASPVAGEAGDDEKPVHKVRITKGFWMGQTPVTVGAYKRYAQAMGKAMPHNIHSTAWPIRLTIARPRNRGS